MKKIILPLLICLVTAMFTSCIVIVDDEGNLQTPKGTVQIQNCDPDREAYIKTVQYWDEFLEEWVDCWNYSEDNTDSYITFRLSPDYYTFKITVIYPLYDGYRDWYDTFQTDYDNQIYVSGSSYINLRFDGKELYRI